jgi:polyhydroxyalkanoate synthesis regulator phasin
MQKITKPTLTEFIEKLTNQRVSGKTLKPELLEQLKNLLKGFKYNGGKNETDIRIFIKSISHKTLKGRKGDHHEEEEVNHEAEDAEFLRRMEREDKKSKIKESVKGLIEKVIEDENSTQTQDSKLLKEMIEDGKRTERFNKRFRDEIINPNLEMITEEIIDEKNNEEIDNFINEHRGKEFDESNKEFDCIILIPPKVDDRC